MAEPDSHETAREGAPPIAYRRGQSPFRAAPKESLVKRALPVSAQIPDYRPPTARRDLIAGVTVAALALPSEGMTHVDSTGVETLNDLTTELNRDSVGLVLARMRPYLYDGLSAPA